MGQFVSVKMRGTRAYILGRVKGKAVLKNLRNSKPARAVSIRPRGGDNAV